MPTTHDGGGESGAGACSLGDGSCLAHLSLVVVEHERGLNVVGEPAPTSGAAASKKKKKESVYAQICRQRAVADFETAPKRRRGDPPDSCGKAGDPHDLDEGQLANNPYTRSKKSRSDGVSQS